ncbi:hypothetical protein LXL04_004335 [Taraxacum kok-saghyz]
MTTRPRGFLECDPQESAAAAHQQLPASFVQQQVTPSLLLDLGFDSQPSSAADSLHGVRKLPDGFSLVERMNEFIAIGHAMGYSMDVVEGLWVPLNINLMVISVYAPQDPTARIELWSRFVDLVANWNDEVIILGDFNDVRFSSERSGSVFCPRQAAIFNNFISSIGFVDIPLGGYSFTWTDKVASKMSKLDRFLVSPGLCHRLPDLSGLALKVKLKTWSFSVRQARIVDRARLQEMLVEVETQLDRGQVPDPSLGSQSSIVQKLMDFDRIESLNIAQKAKIRWAVEGEENSRSDEGGEITGGHCRAAAVAGGGTSIGGGAVAGQRAAAIRVTSDLVCLREEAGDVFLVRLDPIYTRYIGNTDSDTDIQYRQAASVFKEICTETSLSHATPNLLNRLHPEVTRVEKSPVVTAELLLSPEVVQASEVEQWLDKGQRRLGLPPIWCVCEKKRHFSERFSKPFPFRASIASDFPSRLTPQQQLDLEALVTREEVKRAVWDCGSDKAPGPDGFTFEFFRKFWYLVEDDVVGAILEFFSSAVFPRGCNPSFIALIPKVASTVMVKDFRPISLIGCQLKIVGKILSNRLATVIDGLVSKEQSAFVKGRQILDGPLILNEVVAWCKATHAKSMVLRWDFLDDALLGFGFGPRWRSWIRGSLVFSMGSVLVNGSATPEFRFFRGLRQGDPLSPFLFILAMESLHIAFSNAMIHNRFSGLSIGSVEPVVLSHLFYADDAIFIGDCAILSSVRDLCGKGVDLMTYCSRRFGIGDDTLFWYDVWLLDTPLKSLFPRLYALENDKMVLVRHKFDHVDWFTSFCRPPRGGAEWSQWEQLLPSLRSVVLSTVPDRWRWTLNGLEDFSVSSARNHIDSIVLPNIPCHTRWNKLVPIKVNVFIWRLFLDRLPFRWNLSIRGMDIASLSCPVCDAGTDMITHLSFNVG